MAKWSHSVNNLLINIKASIYFCWNEEFTNISAAAGGIFKSNNDDSLYFLSSFIKSQWTALTHRA